jgi:hypothetical protein
VEEEVEGVGGVLDGVGGPAEVFTGGGPLTLRDRLQRGHDFRLRDG